MNRKRGNPWRFAFLALAVWGVFRLFPGIWVNMFILLLHLKAELSPGSGVSVGIIGGSDGPTAIFLTSNPAWIHYVLLVLAIVAGLWGYIKLRKSE